ncbi:MAG TPA: flagellar hook-basal body complex protein FliE [Polyangiaceae bacterium]|jgi:flagellar hook-basal body complex protein FliE
MSAISPVDSRPFVITEGARPLDAIGESAGGSAPGSTSAVDTFGNFLGDAIEEANRADFSASQKVEALASGAADDLHGTMISVKEADIAVKLVGTVRNKLLDAFNELWRTSV